VDCLARLPFAIGFRDCVSGRRPIHLPSPGQRPGNRTHTKATGPTAR
jgi:hypothetical protein